MATRKKSKRTVDHLITLSGRGVWALEWLLEHTDATDDANAIGTACGLQLTLLRAYDARTSVFSRKKVGGPLLPIHILAPAKVVNLPLETDLRVSKKLKISFGKKAQPAFRELKKMSEAEDASTVVENALILHCDLLMREFQAEDFFVRDGKTSRLEQVEFFVAKE